MKIRFARWGLLICVGLVGACAAQTPAPRSAERCDPPATETDPGAAIELLAQYVELMGLLPQGAGSDITTPVLLDLDLQALEARQRGAIGTAFDARYRRLVLVTAEIIDPFYENRARIEDALAEISGESKSEAADRLADGIGGTMPVLLEEIVELDMMATGSDRGEAVRRHELDLLQPR